MPPEIQRLTDQFLHNPARIEVSRPATTATNITQELVEIPANDWAKREALRRLIREAEPTLTNAIVFCNRKRDVDVVAKSLAKHGFDAAPIHGDLDQSLRTKTLDKFRAGELKILVASDVAARGLDVPAVSHVFNFDVPIHADDYVHRIGRTGRAGRSGQALCWPRRATANMSKSIEKLTGNKLARREMMDIEVREERKPAPRRHGRRPGTRRPRRKDKRHRDRRPAGRQIPRSCRADGAGAASETRAPVETSAPTLCIRPMRPRAPEQRHQEQAAAATPAGTEQPHARDQQEKRPHEKHERPQASSSTMTARAESGSGGQEPASRLPVPAGAGQEAGMNARLSADIFCRTPRVKAGALSRRLNAFLPTRGVTLAPRAGDVGTWGQSCTDRNGNRRSPRPHSR